MTHPRTLRRSSSASSRSTALRARAGFTMVEVLAVIGVVALLIAILLPAFFAVRAAGTKARSISNLRSVAEWMSMYADENRGIIVPSRFDYTGSPYPGKPRSESPTNPNTGTWTDILWTGYITIAFPDLVSTAGHDYEFDSPDATFYTTNVSYNANPLRAAALNTRGPQVGLPGFFAANNFFDSTQVNYRWWATSQIRNPSQSLFIVESFAGETINPLPGLWGPTSATREVDYRIDKEALILFFDGHIAGLAPPSAGGTLNDLEQIEQIQKIRVTDPTR